jgi:serine/threonine protein kinase
MIWTAGQHLQNGKYEIQEVLGQGGFGITYRALHLRLNEAIVIKTPNEYLKHDPDYDKYVQRFVNEGQILARLSREPHPHIVRVWDLFEEGDVPCLVMDFVPGENLFQLVRRKGALSETEIVPCIRQIGEALATIHEAGLVHRDAHPGNIIIRPSGGAVLIDFGIVKELIPSTQSSTGEAGNRGFAPYEQISRGSRDPTVDVYCLAATLYFAVTGQRPVPSLDRKLHDAVLISPRQLNPTLSKHINLAILEGMALEAEERPPTMQKWLELLEESRIGSSPSPNSPLSNPGHPTLSPQPIHQPHSFAPHPTPNYAKKSFQTRPLPWGWLLLTVAMYAILGVILAINAVQMPIWAVAIIGAVVAAVARAWDGLGANVLAGVWALAVVGALTAGSTVLAGVLVIALVVALVLAFAAEKLVKSFSRFHTFLILLSLSLAGLGAGWAIGMFIQMP